MQRIGRRTRSSRPLRHMVLVQQALLPSSVGTLTTSFTIRVTVPLSQSQIRGESLEAGGKSGDAFVVLRERIRTGKGNIEGGTKADLGCSHGGG